MICGCGRLTLPESGTLEMRTELRTEDGWTHGRGSCYGSAPERANREGDSQPLPSAGTGPAIHELVRADLLKRLELGTRRYGQPLRAYNGRSALQDLYEELLDACCYAKQRLEEERLAEDDGR